MPVLLRAILFLMLALPVQADDDIPTAPVPGWVDLMPIPPADPALLSEASDGVLYLLSDYQLRWRDGATESYGRTVMQVTDRSGLEQAAGFSLDYDPALQTMTLLDVTVIRDGAEIDLTSQLVPELIRREEQLEEGILDGSLTAFYQIPDLRVGDVVDYASLRMTKPVLPGGDRSVWAALEWAVPVVLTRVVVNWPEGWVINQAPLPARVAVMEGPGPEGGTRLEYQRLHHVPPARPEEMVPATADPMAVLMLSADSDWGRITAELSPHYRTDHPLPPEWEERLTALAAAEPDPRRQAVQALRWVQDEIRYVSLSFGAGGILARPPAEVIATGFGDCKDKALLLAVMLRRLGIEAHVALTDLDQGAGLARHLPMLGAFDHAITRIRLSEEEVYWVDPTLSHQGGDLATMAALDYGHALPLTGGGQRLLQPIPALPEQIWQSELRERFRFSALGLFLDVRATYQGGAADHMRARWASRPKSRISADMHDFYLDRMPGLEMLGEMRLEDDAALNRLVTRESYYLSPLNLRAGDLDLDFPFAAEDFAADLPESLPLPRSLPLMTGRAGVYHHEIEVSGAAIDFALPEPVWLENRAFSYALDGWAMDPGGMVMMWTYTGTGADVPAHEVEAVLADRRVVLDTTWFGWDLRP